MLDMNKILFFRNFFSYCFVTIWLLQIELHFEIYFWEGDMEAGT